MPRRNRPAGRSVTMTARVAIRAAAATGERRRFRMELYTGEPLDICGFDRPVVIDLASLDLTSQLIPALLDHMDFADCVVGQIDALTVAAQGMPPLVAEGYFTATDDERDAARYVLAKADAGFVWQASIGAEPGTLEPVEKGQSVSLNGRNYEGPVYVARGAVPREGSFVVLGADRHTSAVLARRRVKGSAMPTFEEWVASQGLTLADLTEQAVAALKITYGTLFPDAGSETPPDPNTPPTNAAEGDPPPEPEEEETPPTNARGRQPAVQGANRPPRRPAASDPVAEENRRLAANRNRTRGITALCEQHGNPTYEITIRGHRQRVDLAEHAISEGWDRQRVELEILRAERGPGPTVMSRSHDRDCTLQALQGAMILRAGARLDHRSYSSMQARFLGIPDWLRAGINDVTRNRIMDAAHQYADMSAVDLARECLRIDGRAAPHHRSEMIRAAFSGSALTQVFTTNVNAVLLSSYMEAGDTTESWTTTTDVNDYKTNERPRVDVGPGLTKLPRGKEADHASFSDSMESYRAYKYAKQFVIDEQDMIDDMLGALSDVPQRFGSAAARIRPDLVYAILLANPTLNATSRALFNSTDANLGTTSALSASTLKVAIAAMQNIRENSINLNLVPTHLLVPPSLRFTAKELVSSAEIVIAGTAGSVTERGARNVIADENLQIVSDSRLENGVTDPDSGTAYSGSATTWFLACIIAHTIEVAYVRGTGRAPRVRSGQLDRGQYGMWWDVDISIGAKALDWKGLRKTTA